MMIMWLCRTPSMKNTLVRTNLLARAWLSRNFPRVFPSRSRLLHWLKERERERIWWLVDQEVTNYILLEMS